MAFQHQNTEVYRSGHGNAHGVPIMPTPQWLINIKNTEVYRSGHNGPHSKCGNGVTRSWVRIPPLPPLGNNTNPDDKLEFVLFFSNEYFGIKVDLNGKKKNQPGV